MGDVKSLDVSGAFYGNTEELSKQSDPAATQAQP